MSKYCAICLNDIEGEDADVLAMGAYGTPRFVCSECASDIDTATLGKNYEEITAAMDRVSKKLSDKNSDDSVAVDAVSLLLVRAARRASEIKEGTYDFALDETQDSEGLDEIPEELRETEEDKRLDEEEEKRAKKWDKILNWVWIAVLVGILGFMVWWIFFK